MLMMITLYWMTLGTGKYTVHPQSLSSFAHGKRRREINGDDLRLVGTGDHSIEIPSW